ncbi:hypothetical protein B0A48_07344 [Cryoendolithus antarcticus]|uniref:G domain-containing protein n=1 Tax=Cryoendolithus antarcticus TaxID=1507870 RepID=A0A1V8T8B5_9PEZI|nr:hypothetical protein B0A48_07344 [Cryoendolithus antarcticus]
MPREVKNGDRGVDMKTLRKPDKVETKTSKSVASALPAEAGRSNVPASSSVNRKEVRTPVPNESQARPSSQRGIASSKTDGPSAPRQPTIQEWNELVQNYHKERDHRTHLEEVVVAFQTERDHHLHQYASLETELHVSQRKIESQNEEIGALQASSFSAMDSARWMPMDVGQTRAELEDLHASIWKLSRTYAADTWLASERESDDPSLRLDLRSALNHVVRFGSKGVEALDELTNVKRASQLCLAALISDHVAMTILESPFFFVADRKAFHDVWKRALKYDPKKAALWRSDTLRLVNPLDLESESAKIETAAIKQSIDVTCKNFATQYAKKIPEPLLRRLESSIHEEFVQELVIVYQKAGTLSMRLWVQRPSLRCDYLADLADIKFDIRSKILQAHSLHRIDDSEDHTHDGKLIKVVVQPAFRAAGTHEAEGYDQYQDKPMHIRHHLITPGRVSSGKSTFIEQVTQLQGIKIGHQYESCTTDVEPFEFELDGRHVTLIDTPGFNDSSRSEAEVLTEIANYLDFTYRNPPHLKLNGIVYMQSIQDPRMYGSSLRNLKMFKDLCGESPMKSVLLTTNRWDKARSCGEFDKAVAKETELRDKANFWQPLISRGARMVRWDSDDTRAGAVEIVRALMSAAPEVLQIQRELVEQEKRLVDTTAGNTVNEEVLRVEKEYQAELVKIRSEMQEAVAARDEEVKEALEQSKKDYERKLGKIREEQDLLHYERRNETRRMQNEMDDLRSAYDRKLEKQLSAQKLDFDEVVAKLTANQGKLRHEQRVAMQAEIDKMKKEKSGKRSAGQLIMKILPLVGTVVLEGTVKAILGQAEDNLVQDYLC